MTEPTDLNGAGTNGPKGRTRAALTTVTVWVMVTASLI